MAMMACLGFAGGAELGVGGVVEAAAADGAEGGHVEGVADPLSTAPDAARTLERAGIAAEGCEAGERGDGPAVEFSEFRQCGEVDGDGGRSWPGSRPNGRSRAPSSDWPGESGDQPSPAPGSKPGRRGPSPPGRQRPEARLPCPPGGRSRRGYSPACRRADARSCRGAWPCSVGVRHRGCTGKRSPAGPLWEQLNPEQPAVRRFNKPPGRRRRQTPPRW